MQLQRRKMSILFVATIVIISAGIACPRTPDPSTATKIRSPESLRKLHKCYTKKVTTTYANFETIMKWYRSTAEVHKSLVKLLKIGESVEKRQLMVMRVSPRENNDRPAVYIEATQHAREWLAPVTLNNFINEMINGYNEGKEPFMSLFNKYIFYFESVSNPDGYVYSFKNGSTRYWRKNRGKKNRECYGVDLNRNWNISFGEKGGSPDPCKIVYQGPSAFSEPETQAMRDFLLTTIGVGNLALYISIHSFSQIWVIPYTYTNEKPTNYDELYRVAQVASNAIVNQTCGNNSCYYEPLNGYDTFGKTTGGSDDWVLKSMRANYSYTLELPPSVFSVHNDEGFAPSQIRIPIVARQIQIGFLTMLKSMKP